MIIGGIILSIIAAILIFYKIKKEIALKNKKQKQELLRSSFHKVFPEVDDKFSDLLNVIGKDEKLSFYRKESSKLFNELLKVFINIVDADKRLDNMDKLRNNLLSTLNNNDNSSRVKEAVEKSKQLINRINKESNELKKYIANAKEEIKATGLDFVHIATEIELSKASGELVDLTKLSTRSQNLSYIASNMPVTTNLLE